MDDEALEQADEPSGTPDVIATESVPVTTYSSHASLALRSAETAAKSSPGGVMVCEHLLLSLCNDPECAASHVLRECGFPAEHVSSTIAFVQGALPAAEASTTVILSPRVERVLIAAGKEAGSRGAERIDTLHVLVALVRERQGIAALALETPGVGFEPLGAAISKAMRDGLTDPS